MLESEKAQKEVQDPLLNCNQQNAGSAIDQHGINKLLIWNND